MNFMNKRLRVFTQSNLIGRKVFEGDQMGLSLVELIVALMLVPVLIYSASLLYLHSARAIPEQLDRAQALLERRLVVGFLERTIPNGNSASVTSQGPNACTLPGDVEWRHQLTLSMPSVQGNPQDAFVYDFVKFCNQTPILQLSTDDGQNFSQRISYYGSVDLPDAPAVPFAYDADTGDVTVALGFKSSDPIQPKINVSFALHLRGGAGA